MPSVPKWQMQRAFALAYFLHRDRELAARIATDAVDSLGHAFQAQARRRYHPLRGRAVEGKQAPRRRRNRVSLTRPALLQLLVYLYSEPVERSQEQTGGVDDDSMLRRYVAYLLRQGVRRNSQWTAVAQARILHAYSTEEAMSVYDLVSQDPDRLIDASAVRQKKSVLLRALLGRFSSLQTCIGPHRELLLQTRPASPHTVALVRRCLAHFTPWGTECVVPERLRPDRDELPELRFIGSEPDSEHAYEMRRLHALSEPICFGRLIAALGLPAPSTRLSIPAFADSGEASPGAGPPDRDDPDELSDADLDRIVAELGRRQRGRRQASLAQLSVSLDGREVARWNTATTPKLELTAGPEAEQLLVRGSTDDGTEVTLAVCLLDGELDESCELRLRCGRSSRLCVRVVPQACADEPHGARLAITLQLQRSPWRSAIELARGAPVAGAAWRALAVALVMTVGWVALHRQERAVGPEPPAASAHDTPRPRPVTRGVASTTAIADIRQVRRVHVRQQGAGAPSQLPEELRKQLAGRDRLAARGSQPDALIVLERAGAHVSVRVVNADWKELWSRSYRGGDRDVAAALVGDLEPQLCPPGECAAFATAVPAVPSLPRRPTGVP